MFTAIAGNEIVIDIFEGQESLGGSHVFNAIAIADAIRHDKLDGHVYMLGTVSTDRHGRAFRDVASRKGINTTMMRETDAPTLTAIVERGAHNNSFHFPDIEKSALTATTLKDIAHITDDQKILVMQGLCSTVQPSGQAWMEYAELNPAMMVVYDANIRLPAIDDVEEHKTLLKRWASISHVMKISDADIEDIYGKNADPVTVIREYLDSGASLVCLTTGANPVQTFTAREKILNALEPMTVQNTVGAGDNFTGGLTAGFAAAGLFRHDAIARAPIDRIAAIVQKGIDQSARHLRLINP